MDIPQDVKDTIIKTVEYVVKNGPSFAERLLKSSPDKFLFLNPDNKHYQYYQSILNKRGEVTRKLNDISVIDLPEPPAFDFLLDLPPITAEDLEIIKLTALFVSVNGSEYQDKLLQRRGDQLQFEFLRETHSLHKLFKSLVLQYNKIIQDGDHIINKASAQGNDNEMIIRAFNRAQYELIHKKKQKEVKKDLKAKQLAYASINWQEFAFVGSIKFDEIDEVQELATPISVNDLIYRSLESKKSEESIDIKVSKVDETNENSTNSEASSNTEHVVIPGMKIKAVGESRLKRKKQQSAQESMVTCPITNKLIPELEFDEHLKTLLRDPRYEEQRENYKRKNFGYESNLTTDQVYQNIKRMTTMRSGIKKSKS